MNHVPFTSRLAIACTTCHGHQDVQDALQTTTFNFPKVISSDPAVPFSTLSFHFPSFVFLQAHWDLHMTPIDSRWCSGGWGKLLGEWSWKIGRMCDAVGISVCVKCSTLNLSCRSSFYFDVLRHLCLCCMMKRQSLFFKVSSCSLLELQL